MKLQCTQTATFFSSSANEKDKQDGLPIETVEKKKPRSELHGRILLEVVVLVWHGLTYTGMYKDKQSYQYTWCNNELTH